MILLNRYILAQFIRNLGLILVSFISLYTLIDFFEKIDHFMEKGKAFSLAGKFFLANIPYIVDLMGPVCILLAGVVTLGSLNTSNELIALKACGIPLKKIIRPIIGGAIACMLVFLAMIQFVLPTTVSQTNEIWNKEVRGKVPLGIYRNGRYYYRGIDGFYSFARPDPHVNAFDNFSYTIWDGSYQVKTILSAKTATWDKNAWTLNNGQMQQMELGGRLVTTIFTSRQFHFPEMPSDFFVPEYRTMELSLNQLYRETKHAHTAEARDKACIKFYGRISYTLLGLPLLLLGLPVLLIVYRAWGQDLSLAIPVSCGIAFACWGVYTILQSLAKAGYMPALLAAFSIHVVIGAIGLYLLKREDN